MGVGETRSSITEAFLIWTKSEVFSFALFHNPIIRMNLKRILKLRILENLLIATHARQVRKLMLSHYMEIFSTNNEYKYCIVL